MKTYTQEELNKILELHKKWLEGEDGGVRANLEYANLEYAKPKYGTIVGVQIFKVLQAWTYKHNVEFVFCSKAETGKKIIELLGIRDG